MNDKQLLETKCKAVRRDIISEIEASGAGHPGGSLSGVELLVCLYFHSMKVNPKEPKWKDRDRFILSKGHASALLYAVLAERGYFPVAELSDFRRPWGRLPGHPDMRKVPGVEMTTGSLGQGLSVAGGMALAAKIDGAGYKVFSMLGDGEIQEGQIWEAAMSAAHYKLDNLIAIVDRNGLQIDGGTESVMGVEPLADKWKGFGWNVLEIEGHDIDQILRAFDEAKKSIGKPTVIIAKTVKGKGVSFMEGKAEWHGKAPTGELLAKAKSETETK